MPKNIYIYEVCPESIQPCAMKKRHFIEEDKKYKKHGT